jgi:hypothetical protein
MIPEPESYGGQPRRGRNNNLLCYAIVLFAIGLGVLQGIVPIFLLFFPLDAVVWTMIVLFGVLPALGAVYILWNWWQSDL